jgi:CubicO group peptidase (beta-lactamase class C family)
LIDLLRRKELNMAFKARLLNRKRFLQGAGTLAVLAATGGAAFPVAAEKDTDEDEHHSHPVDQLKTASPEQVGMSSARLEDVSARLQNRIEQGLVPGMTALVARYGKIVFHRAYGVRVRGTSEAMTTDTLFDLESMTKVLATATTAMMLVERGDLKLSDRVANYLPDFAANGKSQITIRDMLRYSAGLPVDNNNVTDPPEQIWKFMAATSLEYPTGTMVEYSDLTYRLLGRTLEVVAGMSLDAFAKKYIWKPLGMKDTTYNPYLIAGLTSRVAATGPGSFGLRPGLLRGQVQDDQDWVLGGIVGCDGVFSTTGDIAVFCQMILNGGTYRGVQILKPNSVREMTRNQTPQVTEATTDTGPLANLLFTPKGYGWELWTHRFSVGGMRLSPGSFGKTGGAGTFMWIDPKRELFAILLTNHGLPIPFDEPGWDGMLDRIAVAQFYDGVINAVTDKD